jgi:hypothetical protein
MIATIIRDNTHGYTKEMLPNQVVDKLAVFVSRGHGENWGQYT